MACSANNFAKKALRQEMDSLFEKYRICKYLVEDEENKDTKQYADFCQKIEKAVNHLPDPEMMVIKERYMKDDYVTDHDVYYNILMISPVTYDRRRKKAFEKLNSYLRINDIFFEKKSS